MIDEIITIISAYLLGSIPTAVWVGKKWYDIDVREHGSKNAGATNTFRVLGKKAGKIVLLIDVLKGMTAVLIPYFVYPYVFEQSTFENNINQIIAAIFAVVGHVFPIFAGFKGGKGVATSLGIIIGIQPIAAMICLAVFLIVFIISKYVSLGSIIASVCFPVLVCLISPDANEFKIFSIVLASAVILAHHKNIKRLIQGSESKMNLFKK